MIEALVKQVRVKTKKNLIKTGFGSDKKLIVAVSGGPDSMTLLDVLGALSFNQRLALHVAHLNHGIRSESLEIAEQLADHFNQIGVEATLGQVNAPKFQKQSKLSLEEASRYLRYQFLTGVFIDQQADAIAIAHTADDQAETVLMHLIRGSGINGLLGMRLAGSGKVYPDLPSAHFIRPLLTVTKVETEKYCQAMGLNPEHDYTNDQIDYQRNRIRHQLLPELSTYNPQIKNILSQLGLMSSEVTNLLDNLVQAEWDRVIVETDSGLTISRKEFKDLEPAIKSHLLRRYIELGRGSLKDINFIHLQQLLSLMRGSSGKYTVLPGGAVFKVDKGSGFLEIDPN